MGSASIRPGIGREVDEVDSPPRGRSATLDSLRAHSYLQLIPFNRFPAAHSCARRFFVWRGFLATRWGGRRPVELKKDNEWLVSPGSTSPPTSAWKSR